MRAKRINEALSDVLKGKEFPEGFEYLIEANNWNSYLDHMFERGIRSLAENGYSPEEIQNIIENFMASNEVKKMISNKIEYMMATSISLRKKFKK